MTPELNPVKNARARAWVIAAIVFVIGFDLAFLWQRRAATNVSELGGHPEEAAHYVTGLAVQHYLAHEIGSDPRSSIARFALHYPIVRPAAWPPLQPIVQAAWISAFGKSRTAIMLLMCLLAAVVGWLLHRALRDEFGDAAGIVAVAIFLSLPLVREHYSIALPAMLCTVWMFAAALAFGRFLEREKPADALCFGGLAALAILTDGMGLALVLFVPLALLFSKKWRLTGATPFWSGIALAGLLAGPLAWHFHTPDGSRVSLDFTRAALPFYATRLATACGIGIVAFAAPILVAQCLRPAERPAKWAAALALLAATVLFAIVAPAALDPLHLLPAVPPVIMFAVAGCALVAKRFRRSPAFVLLIVGVLTVALFERVFMAWNAKEWSGFRPLADEIIEADERAQARVLICSDRVGDGMFIAEIAMSETQPGRTIARADTLFANTEFAGDEELAQRLVSQRFDYIVFDESNPGLDRASHHQTLRRVLRENSDRFWEISTSPVIRDGIRQDGLARLYLVRAKG